MIDQQLDRMMKGSTREAALATRERRRRILFESVTTGQTNSEVVLRWPNWASPSETTRLRVQRVAGQGQGSRPDDALDGATRVGDRGHTQQ